MSVDDGDTTRQDVELVRMKVCRVIRRVNCFGKPRVGRIMRSMDHRAFRWKDRVYIG